MTEEQIRSVTLFFYFTLLDENLSEKTSHQVIEDLRIKFKKLTVTDAERAALIVKLCTSELVKLKRQHPSNPAMLKSDSQIQLPKGIALGAWRQYHKEALLEDLITVTWCKVIRFESDVVASGLEVSQGTINYRLGRGLRQLGRLITLGEIIA